MEHNIISEVTRIKSIMGLIVEQGRAAAVEKLWDKFSLKYGISFADDATKAAERLKFERNLGSRFDDLEKLDQELAAGFKTEDEIESVIDNLLDDTDVFSAFERTIATNPVLYREFAIRTAEEILRAEKVLPKMKSAINLSATKDEALRKVDVWLDNLFGINSQNYKKMFEQWVEKNYDPSVARKAAESGRRKYANIADDWEEVKKMKGASEALKDPVKKEKYERVKEKFDSLTNDELKLMEDEIFQNWKEIEAKLKDLEPNRFQKGWYNIPEKRRKMIPWLAGAAVLFPTTTWAVITGIPSIFKKIREVDEGVSTIITGDDTKKNDGGNQNQTQTQDLSQDQFVQNAVAYDSRMSGNIVKVGNDYFVKLTDGKLLLLKMENNVLYLKDDSGKWVDSKKF